MAKSKVRSKKRAEKIKRQKKDSLRQVQDRARKWQEARKSFGEFAMKKLQAEFKKEDSTEEE